MIEIIFAYIRIVQPRSRGVNSVGDLYCRWLLSCLFIVANKHLSLVIAAQGDPDSSK